MPKITISYRRADSDAIAGRIRDRLAGYYGDASVFMDIDNIPFGLDFREHIKAELAQNDILVAVVGPKWLGPGKGGRLRISEETDPVRIEIETALQRGIPVIPVLVQGAVIPKPADLPDAMQSFAFHNAAQVDTGRDFHTHMDRLIRSIDRVLGEKSKTPAASRRKWLAGAIAAGAFSLVLLAGGAWFYWAKLVPSAPQSPPAVVAAAPAQQTPEQPVVAPPSQQQPPPPPSVTPAASQRIEPWQAHPRIPANEYQETYNRMGGNGYRLRSISGYVVDGAEFYAALWIKAGGQTWAHHGLTASALQQRNDALSNEGYRPTWISAHEFGGQVRFAGIWEKKDGPAWRMRFGLTVTELQATIEELGKEKFQPVHLYGYANEGASNFAVIWEKTDAPPPPVKFDMVGPEWTKTWDELNKQGYRPKVITAYHRGYRSLHGAV